MFFIPRFNKKAEDINGSVRLIIILYECNTSFLNEIANI